MNEEIKNKIKKLLALSKSSNENEAMAALEKAHKLMEENNLSEAECDLYSSDVKLLKSHPLWRAVLADACAWINGCDKRNLQEDCICITRFFGSETDVFIAKQMYEYLVKTVNRMARKNISKRAKKRYINSYKEGLSWILYQRMHEAGDKYSWANKRDLQINEIKKVVDKIYYTCSRVFKTQQNKINSKAFHRGFSDGKDISLNRQAGGKMQKAIGVK